MNEAQILSEVYSTLTSLGYGFIDAIPPHIYYYIKDNRDKDYHIKVDKNIPFEEQNISDEALSVIAELHLRYFCNSETEKSQIERLLEFNESKASEELIKNIFKK